MPVFARSRDSDVITGILALALAVACAVFAGYKVTNLNRMENPPADLGLNFPPAKRRTITDEQIAADPLVTGSFSRPTAWNPWIGHRAEAVTFSLVSVIDDVAFVDVRMANQSRIVPVMAGSRLPGLGTIDHIRQIGGRWVLEAGPVTLTAAPD